MQIVFQLRNHSKNYFFNIRVYRFIQSRKKYFESNLLIKKIMPLFETWDLSFLLRTFFLGQKKVFDNPRRCRSFIMHSLIYWLITLLFQKIYIIFISCRSCIFCKVICDSQTISVFGSLKLKTDRNITIQFMY